MTTEARCLVCYQSLEGSSEYHARCARRLFGTPVAPSLDLDSDAVEKLALAVVNQRLALTGVQRKLSLSLTSPSHEPPRLTVVGALGGTHILKPPSPEYPDLPQVEHVTMALAELAGIAVAAHGLMRMTDGALAYVTRRFDRVGRAKVAVEDLCQLSEKPTAAKYRSSYEKVGKVVRVFSSNPGDDALRFFEVLVFSFLTGNADMHLKNFSMLTKADGICGLSPAYDLVSTRLLIPERLDPEELALPLNGRKRKVTKSDFVALAESLKIPSIVVDRTFVRFARARPAWNDCISRSFLPADKQAELRELVSARSQHLETGPNNA